MLVKIINSFILVFSEKYDIFCDHGEAPMLFIDSLKKKKMMATPVKWPISVDSALRCQNRRCGENCTEMGINAYLNKKLKGAFYV